MKFHLFFILLNYLFCTTFCCNQHKTCRECIRDENKCVWCSDENFKKSVRCKSDVGLGDWCSGHIQNPKSPKPSVMREDEFNSEKAKVVQLKPQEIKLHLRPGQTINFEFTYKRARNYPLDFYFLLDGSGSMKNYTIQTADQSMLMYDMLRNMTDDILVGMGTFIDKNAMPYTDKVSSNKAYSFKNLLKLNQDFRNFQNVLYNMSFGLNVDEPEGGLDALAQVMACKDEIGWRKQSRKIIVLNTDSTYHHAGHGLLAGIIQPYDGKCYTKNDIYTKELEMDYPSVSIIRNMAVKDAFVIIFVVKLDRKEDYKPLTESVGAYLTEFNQIEVKVKDTLSHIYNNIADFIELTEQINSAYKDYFEITFKPNCKDEKCPVKINDVKKFTGTIKLLNHLDAERVPINVAIKGLNEKLLLDVHIIKECDCKPELKSPDCNRSGSKTCGICECDSGWHGEYCQCSAAAGIDNLDKGLCMANGKECSDHGVCECAKCICMENFRGEFCECNKQNCTRGSNGQLCSGHGTCGEIRCGECKCDDDWAGEDCSCSMLQTNCKEEGQEICSGLGDCKCNKCTCGPPASWDTRSRDYLCAPVPGETADDSRQCIQLQACVLNYLNDGQSGCDHVNIVAVDALQMDNHQMDLVTENIQELSADEGSFVVESPEVHLVTAKPKEPGGWIECPEMRADVGCYTKYVYKYDEDSYGVNVMVQTKLNCAETYYWAGGGCLIGLVLIGLVTLVCWKVLTTRRDRAEYERFFKEVQSENPELINPIFAPATVSFSNPAFRRSVRGT